MSDMYEPTTVPSNMPRNAIASKTPLPNAASSLPPMSLISPYFDGEYKLL